MSAFTKKLTWLSLFTFHFSLFTFFTAPAYAQFDLPACTAGELNYLEPASLANSSADCPSETYCVTPVAGDVLMCNKIKDRNATSQSGGVEVCPGNPALYSVTTPPNSQTCPIFKKACLIPGNQPTHVCIPDNVKGSCDPTADTNCPSAKGVECSSGVVTALGCVKTEPAQIIGATVAISVGAGGGVSLLVMIYGAFQMLTSGGSGDRLKEGRERFLAAAIGLTFITLAVFLLQIIGIDILNLPGFSR
jgi:hypothetical protein